MHRLLTVLLLAACAPSPFGSCPHDTLAADAIDAGLIQPIDPESWRVAYIGHERDPALPSTQIFDTQAEWDWQMVAGWDTQAVGPPPSIDWVASEVVAIALRNLCPVNVALTHYSVECSTGAIHAALTWSAGDCACNPPASLVAAFIVPRGSIQAATLDATELPCEGPACVCAGGP